MFTKIREKMQSKFDEMVCANAKLFYVEVDKEKIWKIYLDAIPEEHKQSNVCNCCRNFIRMYAGIVAIKDNKKLSLWDFEAEDAEYNDAVKALKKYISSLPIKGIFLNTFAKCGTNKNVDSVRNVIWNHFYLELPKIFVKPDIGPLEAVALDNKNVLMRSLKEITDDAVDTVIELIGQNSLYRGNEFLAILKQFKGIKTEFKNVPVALQDNFCWVESGKVSGAVTRIRNTSIGTLLNDLSDGVELDTAVTSFERVVAPSNYKRVTVLATPKMIDAAKTRLEELSLINALNRRMLSSRDLAVTNALYVDRPQNQSLDVFEDLKKGAVVNPKTFNKIEEISIDEFIEKVLPTARNIRALVDNNHFGNFASLIGPKDQDAGQLFKWNNPYSWSYTGGVSDSIKDKVKAAGGRVDGYLRVSLSWSNGDDLDLAVYEPNKGHIYFGNKTGASGVQLDVDMNAGGSTNSVDPVENMVWKVSPTQEGRYKVYVNNYNKRGAKDQGFVIETECEGEVSNWSFPNNTVSNILVLEFDYSKKNGVVFGTPNQDNGGKKYNSKEKWSIKSGTFNKVKFITTSPNCWTEKPIGNKHYFFMLDGCKSDEESKPFLNEFLHASLDKERKTMEMLNSKFVVEKSDGDELSGLGFSDTLRAELILEVEGTFKRTVKVKF